MCSPVRSIPLAEVLRDFSPTDMIPGGTHEGVSNPELWRLVFGEIEREHEAFAPAYWAAFKRSVAKRQRVPIVLHGTHVSNGHHRVWALHASGKSQVRVRESVTASP
jgi:hypothetical protein